VPERGWGFASQEVMAEQMAGVPEEERRKILAENARGFFHLD
jgi:hypothetical protein